MTPAQRADIAALKQHPFIRSLHPGARPLVLWRCVEHWNLTRADALRVLDAKHTSPMEAARAGVIPWDRLKQKPPTGPGWKKLGGGLYSICAADIVMKPWRKAYVD